MIFRETNVGKYQKSVRLFNQTNVFRYKQLRIFPEPGFQFVIVGVNSGGGPIGEGNCVFPPGGPGGGAEDPGNPGGPEDPGNPGGPGGPEDPGNPGGPGGKKPGCCGQLNGSKSSC